VDPFSGSGSIRISSEWKVTKRLAEKVGVSTIKNKGGDTMIRKEMMTRREGVVEFAQSAKSVQGVYLATGSGGSKSRREAEFSRINLGAGLVSVVLSVGKN